MGRAAGVLQHLGETAPAVPPLPDVAGPSEWVRAIRQAVPPRAARFHGRHEISACTPVF